MDGTPRKTKKIVFGLGVLVAAIAGTFFLKCGFYSIQPIGALPEGATVIVWRRDAEPFFNSPDALCIEVMGGVSLLCRGAAMARAPKDRILLRLPYQRWAYLESTGDREFDR